MLASRLILIGAAAIATVSIGVVTMRPKNAPPTQARVPQQTLTDMIAQIETRTKSNPNDVESWRMLGAAFSEAGRFGESATAYRRAATLQPQVAENWANLGEALVMAGQGDVPPDAKAAFITAVARDSKNVRGRYFLAVAKDVAGDHRGAIDDWFALLKDSAPNAPWQGEVRGLIQQVAAKEKIDVAARLVALPAMPRGPDAAQIEAARKMPPDEQKAMIASMVDGLDQRLTNNPQDVEGWTMLIRSYAGLNRKNDAIAALQRAIKANPEATAELNQTAKQLGLR